MSEIVALAGLFCLVILLLRLKAPLSLSLLTASLAGGFLFRIPLSSMVSAFQEGIFSWNSWHLLGCILTITTLGSLLRRRGKLADMALGAERILKSRKAALGAIPALIGMMPMPGGARFSAPMVEELDAKKELTPEEKSSINYLFRHVMEFLFPLYPGMLFFASLLKTPVFNIVYALVPLFVVLFLGSLWCLDKRIPLSLPQAGASKSSPGWKLLLSGLWPVLLIVTLSLGLHLDILYALLGTLFLGALYFQAGGKELRHSLKEGIGVKTVFSILSIMVFQQVLGSSDAIRVLPFFLHAWPPILGSGIFYSFPGWTFNRNDHRLPGFNFSGLIRVFRSPFRIYRLRNGNAGL